MGSKQEYEARKAIRQKQREAKMVLDDSTLDIDALDILDRLATAFERIADSLEGGLTKRL